LQVHESSLIAYDRELRQSGAFTLLCGVDEAGRGPLAGPVTAAAVILPSGTSLAALNDSKKLSARRRQELESVIQGEALAWALGWASASEIDRTNILKATFLAMGRALAGLGLKPDFILVDGRDYPFGEMPGRSQIKGDATSASIAAASILAKEARDRYMRELDERYPAYGFARHMGYGTAAHMQAIREHGPTPEHRQSFRMGGDSLQSELFST
jgi:ribonuclease HII